jgi:hypothetical protein
MREEDAPAEEPAHDILAEEFAVPAPDPSLHHGPVVLPDDPSGIAEPHDVLAAEEFALPAVRAPAGALARPVRSIWPIVAAAAVLVLIALRVLRRR